jgi:HAE1 family hydrophobic/amphiphilic exporter-1
MRLTQLFVNRPTLVFVGLALIAMAGCFALATLVQQSVPNIDFPTINVSVSYPGASPSELRDSVVRPIEDAIAGAPDLDHISTSIQQNQASISATFSLDSNHTTDLTQVQDRIQTARSALPADMPAPTIRSFDPAQANIVTLAVSSSTLTPPALSALITNNIVPAIEQVSGVSNVNANGIVTRAIEVTLDPLRLAGFGFTAGDVVSAIQSNNVRAPGGIAYLGNRETAIDVRGDVQTPESIAALLLTGSTAVLTAATSPSGTITQKFTGATGSVNQALTIGSSTASAGTSSATNPFSTARRLVRIGDIAKITDGFEAKRVASYVDGRSVISLSVQKTTGASEVTASHAVLAALPALEAQFPSVAFRVLNVQADYTEQQLFGVLQTLLEGVLFTGITMLFFLHSWRNAIVVMIAIPSSLFVTLFLMKLIGFTIDTVSLLAMTLTIGILVDDSIVVLENIERHHEHEETPKIAAISGRTEIGAAAAVITLVDVVVFLPIAFLPGQTGRFLGEFGFVVTMATLTSLAVSFTITPSLAGNWSLLSEWSAPNFITAFSRGFERLRTFYCERILAAALRWPFLVIALSVGLTAGAIALLPPPAGLGIIGSEFIPTIDPGELFVQIQFPTGTPLSVTDAAIRLLSTRFLDLPDVQKITSTSGSAQASFGGGVNLGSNGQLHIFLDPKRTHSTDDITKMAGKLGHQLVPDAVVTAIQATGTRRNNSQPIDVTVASTQGDPDSYAAQLLQILQNTPGTANVNTSSVKFSPQINIRFNRDRARALDVDIGSAAGAVRAAFGGTLATQFDTNNGTKYVQVLYPLNDQTGISTLRSIALRTRGGAIVHLGDIAVLDDTPQEALITRINRQSIIHLGANLVPGAALSTVQQAFLKRVQALKLPSSVIVGAAAGGSQANMIQLAGSIVNALGLSLLLVFLLMVALYDAYRAPFVIMFAIPVAAVGAFGALALTHQTLNLFSSIGVIMLVGLVSKNGILLVDFAQLKVQAGIDKATAITQAARERFRPIVMTTVSMIAGMTPLALALDPGSAAKRSLGTVVIGGLTSSLLLTLVLVPVIYMWIAPGPATKTETP